MWIWPFGDVSRESRCASGGLPCRTRSKAYRRAIAEYGGRGQGRMECAAISVPGGEVLVHFALQPCLTCSVGAAHFERKQRAYYEWRRLAAGARLKDRSTSAGIHLARFSPDRISICLHSRPRGIVVADFPHRVARHDESFSGLVDADGARLVSWAGKTPLEPSRSRLASRARVLRPASPEYRIGTACRNRGTPRMSQQGRSYPFGPV